LKTVSSDLRAEAATSAYNLVSYMMVLANLKCQSAHQVLLSRKSHMLNVEDGEL